MALLLQGLLLITIVIKVSQKQFQKLKKKLFLQDTNATVYKIINVIEAKLEIVNILESSVSLSLCAAYCDRTTRCEGFR